MGATVYYQDNNISVTSEQVRVGERAFPPSAIDAYEVKVRLIGFHGRESWFVWGLLGLCALGAAVSIFRLVWGLITGISEPGNVYAQDWLDFVLPVAFFLASLYLMFLFPGGRINIVLKLKPDPTSEGATVTWIAPEATKESAVNVATLIDALHKVAPHAKLMSMGKSIEIQGSSPPEDALYWDGVTVVTPYYVRYNQHTLPVADITQVRIAVQSSQSALWVLQGFNALILSLLSGVQLLSNPPVIQDGVILFPRLWLFPLAVLLLMPVLITSSVQAFRRRKVGRQYTVTVHGRFGRSNRDVILPIEILYTYSQEHANKVRAAIQQALGWRAHHYDTIETQAVPGIGQSNA